MKDLCYAQGEFIGWIRKATRYGKTDNGRLKLEFTLVIERKNGDKTCYWNAVAWGDFATWMHTDFALEVASKGMQVGDQIWAKGEIRKYKCNYTNQERLKLVVKDARLMYRPDASENKKQEENQNV